MSKMTQTNNKQFLETVDFDSLKTASKGSYSGGKKHAGLYTNKQGRMFNFSNEKNEKVFGTYYRIKTGTAKNGVQFIAIKQVSNSDKVETDFQVSAKSTKTPFITVTQICKSLFGDDKSLWTNDFEHQGEKDGVNYFTVITEKTEVK